VFSDAVDTAVAALELVMGSPALVH
jgi:hypothetical protein